VVKLQSLALDKPAAVWFQYFPDSDSVTRDEAAKSGPGGEYMKCMFRHMNADGDDYLTKVEFVDGFSTAVDSCGSPPGIPPVSAP